MQHSQPYQHKLQYYQNNNDINTDTNHTDGIKRTRTRSSHWTGKKAAIEKYAAAAAAAGFRFIRPQGPEIALSASVSSRTEKVLTCRLENANLRKRETDRQIERARERERETDRQTERQRERPTLISFVFLLRSLNNKNSRASLLEDEAIDLKTKTLVLKDSNFIKSNS